MLIKFNYVPITKKYKSNIGLAERVIKRKLEKEDWVVFRGGFLHACRKKELYPNILRKYSRLDGILGRDLEYLQLLSRIHHGMPDFFCYRRGVKKFVECKLGHEQLSNRQKRCIRKLVMMGFDVEVFKLVFSCTKLREAYVNIFSNEKIIVEKQRRLNLKN